MTVEELLQRAQQKDEEALDELYRLLEPVLRPMVVRLLRRSAAMRVLDPTDLINTAWRRLLEEEAMPDNLVAWLNQVARRRLFQVQKSHAVSRTHLDGDRLSEVPQAGSKSLLETVVREEDMVWQARKLQRVRGRLAAEIYESLIMHNSGHTWVEIAARFSPGTEPETWARKCGRALEECRETLA